MLQKKDNKILFGTKACFAIARLIFNYPHKKFYIRELCKQTGFSTTSIVQGINVLEDYKLIKTKVNNVTNDLYANLNSEVYRHYKIIFNLYRLINYNFTDILVKYFNSPECISIFGSFARGEDIEQSDIDILIVTSIHEPNNKEFSNFINFIEKEFNRKVNLHILKSLEKSKESFKNAVVNGIVLHGYLKVI